MHFKSGCSDFGLDGDGVVHHGVEVVNGQRGQDLVHSILQLGVALELQNAENAFKKLSCSLLLDEQLVLLEEDAEHTVSGDRHNLVFKKNKPTEKTYPRRNAQIMKNPL